MIVYILQNAACGKQVFPNVKSLNEYLKADEPESGDEYLIEISEMSQVEFDSLPVT